MPFNTTSKIEPAKTSAFSTTVIDYLGKKEAIQQLQAYELSEQGFQQAIHDRSSSSYPRSLLVEVIAKQYQGLPNSDTWERQLSLLKDENTYTVVTAHQCNLFSGPLYFILKTVSAIKQARFLARHFPEHNFIPIFWIGSEDHDFEELNHIYIRENRIEWSANQGGAVGRYTPEGLEGLIEEIEDLGASSQYLQQVRELLRQSFLGRTSVADGMRALLNALFGQHGLLVIDQDDASLKKAFVPLMKQELFEQKVFGACQTSDKQLKELGYKVQAHAREINLFYLKQGFRERIVREGDLFNVRNSNISFTAEEIESELENRPERFSPNVLFRPVYQEFLFPNLAYIGGGGELAYWLQLKPVFTAFGLPMPALMLRDSAIFVDEITAKKLAKAQLKIDDLFRDENEIANFLVQRDTHVDLSLDQEEQELSAFFDRLSQRISKVDKGLEQSLAAEKSKNLKSLNKIAQKLRRAEKRKHETNIQRALVARSRLFPGGKLQERHYNFLHYFLDHGPDFIDLLLKELEPMEQKVTIFAE